MKNSKYYFFIATYFRNKKNTINCIILTCLLLVISILSSFYFTVGHRYDNTLTDNLRYKDLYIGDLKSSRSYEEGVHVLESINHVTNVTNQLFYHNGLYMDVEGEMLGFYMYTATQKSLPKIIQGKTFLDDDGYYIACPVNLYLLNEKEQQQLTDVTINDKFDMSKHIGKSMTFYYPAFSFANGVTSTRKEIELTVVGLYQNSKTHIDENECYVTKKVMEEIYRNQYPEETESTYELNQDFWITVDELENKDYVKTELAKNSFSYEEAVELYQEYFDNIYKPLNISISVIVLITLLLTFLIYRKNINNNQSFYKLLHCLGYSKKDINKISVVSNLTLIISSLIATFILIGIVIIGIKFYLYYKPLAFSKWQIIYNFSLTFIVIIFQLLITLFFTFIKKSRY